ncbi:ATP-binding protein [Ardenticatena maritima]|uniref:Bacterial transcriptional activator domain-containing protein n=3 Tax=Ardenticatena maritima TaxID=872965 RepID=A0A0P6Y6I1_9CHLR|nr:BTAD domain-containing putative transcriptional regulator [Ardenticatena maritima]KPL88369.1 hypothetical protein SE16_06010 [Ardenticatena maritima]
MTLFLRFLGPPQIEQAGQNVPLRQNKGIALLAYVGLADAPIPRERLLALFWPESAPDAARKNLRNLLWELRRTLGEESLQTENDALALAPHVRVDARLLADAAQAARTGHLPPNAADIAALYRGPFLDGLTLREAPDVELWIAMTRERLQQDAVRLLETLLTTARQAGDWRAVAQWAQHALAIDPLHEPMHQALMEAYARLGDRAGALAQYDRLRRLLRNELGVAPLESTDDLANAIRDGRISSLTALPPSEMPPPAVNTPLTQQQPPLEQPPLVGRDAELAALDNAWRATAVGGFAVATLEGELGIGKTRLWQEWAARLPDETALLAAHGLEATQHIPLAPIAMLLRRPDIWQTLHTHSATLPTLTALRHLLPDFLPAGAASNAPLPPAEGRLHLFDALLHALTIATQPRKQVVFVLDDAHWADPSTLAFLTYLAERRPWQRLFLVLALRPEDATPDLNHHIAHWARLGVLAARVTLPHLDADTAAELIKALGGSHPHAEELIRRSGGNPYFLLELLRTDGHDVPPHLRALIAARLERLTGTSRQVAQAAAILDGDFDFDLLRHTAGRSEEETLDALDTLLQRGILREQNGRYEFTHPLIAEVLRSNLSTARQSFLHRRAAQALERRYAGRVAGMAGRIAAHYARAGRPEEAAAWYETAGRHAFSLAAVTEAVTFLREAMRLSPTPQRAIALGMALAHSGRHEEAHALLERIVAEAEQRGDQRTLAEAALTLAQIHLGIGGGDAILHWAQRALHAGIHDDPLIQARLHFTIGAALLRLSPSLEQAEHHLRQALTLAEEQNALVVAIQALFELGNLFAERGDYETALHHYEQVLERAEALDLRFYQVLALNNLAYHHALNGNLSAAQEALERAFALATAHSISEPLQYLHSTRGELALLAGDVQAAREAFLTALDAAHAIGNQLHEANIHLQLGRLLLEHDHDAQTALEHFTQARALLGETVAFHFQRLLELWTARALLALGDHESAARQVAHVRALLHASDRRPLQSLLESIQTLLPCQP